MTIREVTTHLQNLQDNQIIEGFAEVCRSRPSELFVMLYVHQKDYRDMKSRDKIKNNLKTLFPGLHVAFGMISRCR